MGNSRPCRRLGLYLFFFSLILHGLLAPTCVLRVSFRGRAFVKRCIARVLLSIAHPPFCPSGSRGVGPIWARAVLLARRIPGCMTSPNLVARTAQSRNSRCCAGISCYEGTKGDENTASLAISTWFGSQNTW
ncbi:hypothetical protein BC834DRAFT_489396 [Gloeopeniophorella convolvens]|nr:hypothetical protein BC834DRAFT_489396 [Gloeopeniophorella convolvens]